MSNTIAVADIVAKEAAMILHDNLYFTKTINRERDPEFRREYNGAKPGSTIRIRKPAKFTARTNMTFSAQDITENTVSLAVATTRGVDAVVTSAELSQRIDILSNRVIEPAMKQLASSIESAIMTSLYTGVYNFVGTPGTAPNSLNGYLSAAAKLDKFLAPQGDRFALINSSAKVASIDALKGLFQDQKSIADQYKRGMLGDLGGLMIGQNELIPYHTNGTQGGTPLVNGATQTGSSLVTDGWSSGATIKAGTVFTLAGVYAVHPETKAQYPDLQQFVVTADVTADGSGNATLAIAPAITTSGAFQTVSGSPADNAAMTLQTGSASTTYAQNLIYHRDAATVAFCDLDVPKGTHYAAVQTMDGISVRVVADFDIATGDTKLRFDTLFGSALVLPEHMCRFTG